MYKALSLISGGLDSLLATKLILNQGIHVEGINFFTGFSGDHDYCFKRREQGHQNARWVSQQLGIKLHIVNVVDHFKPILLNPKYGYGANLNPCLDCKLFMILQAKTWMEKQGFNFLITGEVLGQRPKSQRKDTLRIAPKVTDDLVIRPLSAKLLPPTLPERKGCVKRELLGDISGRGRKSQIEMARQFGFKEFPQPSGGCLLTDSNFCSRLQDLLNHRLNRDYSLEDVLLLRLGRHLRIKSNLKVVVGRDKVENDYLESFSNEYVLLQSADSFGALVLVDGEVNKNNLSFLGRFAAYFSKWRDAKKVKVSARIPKGSKQNILVTPLASNEILSDWYI